MNYHHEEENDLSRYHDIINDLESTPHIFADDTSLIATANSSLETVVTLNRDLARISSWATRWMVRQPIAVSDISVYICLIDIRSEANPNNN